ncbi:slipin family protein [Candidatus Parcubacteria bacterium]|nr:slipin family protein [Candidatus Parcubacteria bacterium]
MEFFIIALIVLLALGLRVVDQYERGVVLTLGKHTSTRSPGLTWIFPGIQRMIKVDLRILTVDIPRQEVITKDNVTVHVDAVVYYQVKDADRATLDIQDYRKATLTYAQATMRDVVGEVDLDTLLTEREQLSKDIKDIVDKFTDKWGISVDTIKIQNIELPQDMKRAMAAQAEAERERRAVIITAQGEFEAAKKLAEAGKILATSVGSMNLRTLGTLEKISSEASQKTAFIIPADLFEGFKNLTK